MTRSRRRFWRLPRLSWPRVSWRRLRPHSRHAAGVLALLLLTVLWVTRGGVVEAKAPSWSQQQILAAIRFIESSDRENPPDGDDGKAIGPYQIHRVYWLDATEFDASLGGSYQDCRKRAYAEHVIDAYMRRYADVAWTQGHAEKIARIHNGGPKGHQKQATLGYWQRVHDRLSEPR